MARSFTGPDGKQWNAWNVHPGAHADWPKAARRHLPPQLADGWLCFEGEGEKRRLTPIPEGWEEWPEDRLRGACSDAEAVRRRPRADN